MAVAKHGVVNFAECPPRGSRTIDSFEKLDQIGSGTYGLVYKARDIESGEIVALKKLRKETDGDHGFPINALREIKILQSLNHENVMKLKEVVTSPGPEPGSRSDGNKYKGGIYMVFEYMDHDLEGLMNRPEIKITIPQIKCYMRQLLKGLHYCHLNKVLHRDIKAPNLLINNEGVLKIADFGLAKSVGNLKNKAKHTNRVVTLCYRPPELLLGTTDYGSAVDMWSAGCIFAELLDGKNILRGRSEPDQINKIFRLCGTPDEGNWPGVSNLPYYNQFKPSTPMKRRLPEVYGHFDVHALELLERMLTLNPNQRITAKDALEADYFWNDPLPCDPRSLPKYESSHSFKTRKMQVLQHLFLLTPQSNQPIHDDSPRPSPDPIYRLRDMPGDAGPSGKGGSGNEVGAPNQPQGGPYLPPGRRRSQYGSGDMPGAAGPSRGGSGYGVGVPNHPQGGPYHPPSRRRSQYGSGVMTGAGPSGGGGSGYGVGALNHPQGGPYCSPQRRSQYGSGDMPGVGPSGDGGSGYGVGAPTHPQR